MASTRLVGAAVFAVAVAAFSRIPLLPEIGSDLSLGVAEIGLLTTAFGLGRLLMDLPAGRLAAAVEPSASLAAAGAGLAIACAMLALSRSIAEALVASSLIGAASALTNTTGMFAFATATPAARRGASMAAYTTALMAGQMVGPALGGVFGSLAGWRAALALSAAIAAGVGLACLVWRRSLNTIPRPDAGRANQQPLEPAPESPPSRRELTALAAAPFATFFGLAGLTQTLIPLVGDRELGFSAGTIGIALGIGVVARFASAWLAGVGSDRLSRRVVLVPCLLVMGAGAAVFALPTGELGWGAAIVLVAFGSSATAVAAAALADRVPRHALGRELGMFRLVGDLGLLVGPLVCGFLYQEEGLGAAGWAAAAVFLAAALAATLWVGEGDRDVPRRDHAGELPLD